jgi:biopolymer transport protein ExbD
MSARRRRPAREPTIALINIVFLMLVFFLVAGTVAQPLDPELRLVRTTEMKGTAPPDALVLHRDGRMSYRGEDTASAEDFLAARGEAGGAVRVVPDRDLPAARLVEIGAALRAAGAESVLLVTERGLE